MNSKICVGCRLPTVAEIKDLSNYDEHNVPVWYCETCKLSTPTKRKDRHEWVNDYLWDPPGFIYGARAYEYKVCPGCMTNTMFADSTFLINEIFPFFEGQKPAWTCARCGFSDKVVKEDGNLWADMFNKWG